MNLLKRFNNFRTWTAILIIGIVCEAVLTGLIPHSRGFLYGILESKEGAVWVAIGLYFVNQLFLDIFQAVKSYIVLKVALFRRDKRTPETVQQVNSDTVVTNVPQRVQEDIKFSYLFRITVWAEYAISALILIQLIILNIPQPILLCAAFGYAGLSVAIAVLFNPRLTRAEKMVQEGEAEFRARLTANLGDLTGLELAKRVCLKSEAIKLQYQLFTKLQICLLVVLPYIVLVPQLMDGLISLGGVVQYSTTFSLIVVNAAILIAMYPQLIKGKASEERVKVVEDE